MEEEPEEGRGEDEADEEDEEDDADFDPLSENVCAPSLGVHQQEEAVDDQELGLVDEDYDGTFVELGSEHEQEEVEEDEAEADDEEEDEDDEEKDEEDLGAVVDDEKGNAEDGSGAGAAGSSGKDQAGESSSHEEEAELMGNALEALPELHSPDHGKYVVHRQEMSNLDEEEAVMDAISKRTRAHYSLADMTLDQLETFLQESDEDDYFHNVDDEEEYRKFLSAVTGEGEMTAAKDGEEDEDEEDDADFELEIEEALEAESDYDESQQREAGKISAIRRPETRELRRERMQRPFGQARTPLRPLVPYHGGSIAELPGGDRSRVMVETAYRESLQTKCPQSLDHGFTADQLGQLHCLIHEHVQLLVQVFSLCVLEPSRQQTAMTTHRLLTQLADKYALPSRSEPLPDFCFRPPHVHPSVVDQVSNWQPSVSQPLLSVAGVAPLDLLKEFLQAISEAAQRLRQQHLESGGLNIRKEPLFQVPRATGSSAGVSHPSHTSVKKTMAAILVENTKKQSVALVPQGIVQAVSRLAPFFNPALFPYKPPPATTVCRLLFTDSEDELLATGLMTYNNDWKAIQERFLPTKSTHQIFVRQKNRSSARAPENSIKAVRRMKNAPLTLQEKENIQEALRFFKYDWSKVWQYAVPHRDPALLPRQWRTALGTQKSYKSDEVAKEKRRLHEANKRRLKAMRNSSTTEDELGTPGEVTNERECSDGTHIHEAFLSDWRSGIQSQPQPTVSTKSIKLAPDLPALNLPPHVRVIPQSTFEHGKNAPHSQVHPLLLRPSCPPTSRTESAGPSLSAFHPFFGKKDSERPIPTQPLPGASSSAFHPLLQLPSSMREDGQEDSADLSKRRKTSGEEFAEAAGASARNRDEHVAELNLLADFEGGDLSDSNEKHVIEFEKEDMCSDSDSG